MSPVVICHLHWNFPPLPALAQPLASRQLPRHSTSDYRPVGITLFFARLKSLDSLSSMVPHRFSSSAPPFPPPSPPLAALFASFSSRFVSPLENVFSILPCH